MQSNFEAEARLIVSRNLSPNVAGVRASLDSQSGHLILVYYLISCPTEDNEDLRELSVAELIAAFPKIRTASSEVGTRKDIKPSGR